MIELPSGTCSTHVHVSQSKVEIEPIRQTYIVRGTKYARKFGIPYVNFIPSDAIKFNGINQHSIVVMDNASIHHVDGITELRNSGSII